MLLLIAAVGCQVCQFLQYLYQCVSLTDSVDASGIPAGQGESGLCPFSRLPAAAYCPGGGRVLSVDVLLYWKIHVVGVDELLSPC